MKLIFLPVWGFVYEQFAAKKSKRRVVDMRKDDPRIEGKTYAVYMEFNFKPGDKAPGFTGKFCVRRIRQTLRGYPCVDKDCVVMYLTSAWWKNLFVPRRIKKEVARFIAEHKEKGGVLPL